MSADYLGDPDFDEIEQAVDRLLMLKASEREAALAGLRLTDPARAAKVARWLQDIEASDGFLEPKSRQPGQRIGAWALVRLLGRGGMGEVWLAERADGVYLKYAAIKFLRLDRADTARRLIQERAVLARLEHPNIARLLDAGEDAEAGAYLITDWIDGRNLDQWLRAARPDLTQCLAVFRPIAEAVSHAHRQLIIHRDIKPANVMVDAEQRAFLLDFGIARILEGEAHAIETRDLAATPHYAAPEQLQGRAVDTRADVYGLGALLYRLLTDQDPLPLKGLALAELVRTVCEQTPLPPSQRAPDRGIPRDLDTICLKALEKAPEQRYQSVDALLADLTAYERGEPVLARQGGWGYRLGKFFWRHRVASSAAALLLLAIVAGAGTTWWQARLAAKESERANAVKTFLMDLFASIDPEQSKGGQVLAEDLVQAGELRLHQASDLDPELRYELLSMLARMRLDLRQFDARLRNQIEACALAAQNFGTSSDEAVVCTIELADSQRQIGQHEAANQTLDPVLQTLEQARAPDLLRLALAYEVRFMIERDLDHPDAAETAIRRSIELSRQAEPTIGTQTAHSLEQYAVFLNAAGRFAEAEPLLLEILAFDQAHPDARSRSEQINSRWNLLTYYWSRERYQDVLTATANLRRETEADLGRNHSACFR
ncbi:MAG: serine/threonine protein kinase [Ahniella sp.]|nr:serine/threonine protein kinase [Ahniella sp.]